jgi:hypothetical protein
MQDLLDEKGKVEPDIETRTWNNNADIFLVKG